MNAGQTLTIGGRTAEVIRVRKTAPVAVVRFGDGSTDLHWFGEEPSAPPAKLHVEPHTGREPDEAPDAHDALELDHNGGGATVCRDCSKSWTGFKPEHCMSCHETFGGTYAGDLHRVGKYGSDSDPRRCLDPVDAGLEIGNRGYWSRPLVWV